MQLEKNKQDWYQPKTGRRCSCRPGVWRDNCSNCEGTGWIVDFAAIRRSHQCPTCGAGCRCEEPKHCGHCA